ncbi:hypothetical protein HMPREF0063_11595 [Aeromicrobium marinum DSM 15272]|uniref:DUF4287 domain-containing protein n=1 Tax=Aeromicrobium marinum DSM 15272 TaxID=585531 RepID=E2SC36_9ACTN|nr:DUF4287 domain-containing protein [Aeromicrobium marinum]EFQ83322.1 hypothetical protein HMPREF0063_11595 [Aeromicrobium marinum DSM 15272]
MSAQSYLTTIETKTGLTPRQLVANAAEAGFSGPDVAVAPCAAWFKETYGLGHGHAMTMAQVVKQLDRIDLRNEGITEPPTGSIGRLWLDGKDTCPS